MPQDRHPSIVNLDELDYRELAHGRRYAARHGLISQRLGAHKLGYRITEVPPGKTAFPYHGHLVNEEMVFILEGSGRLRLKHGEYPLRSGDFIALPAGPDQPHQILNTGGTPLRYLAVSTMEQPDVVRYPDSQKLAVFAGAAPGGRAEQRSVSACFPEAAAVDYWEGED